MPTKKIPVGMKRAGGRMFLGVDDVRGEYDRQATPKFISTLQQVDSAIFSAAMNLDTCAFFHAPTVPPEVAEKVVASLKNRGFEAAFLKTPTPHFVIIFYTPKLL